MTVDLLVHAELGLRCQAVAVVEEAGDEGEVNTEELLSLVRRTAGGPGSLQVAWTVTKPLSPARIKPASTALS